MWYNIIGKKEKQINLANFQSSNLFRQTRNFANREKFEDICTQWRALCKTRLGVFLCSSNKESNIKFKLLYDHIYIYNPLIVIDTNTICYSIISKFLQHILWVSKGDKLIYCGKHQVYLFSYINYWELYHTHRVIRSQNIIGTSNMCHNWKTNK